jgi:hypothetical protein
LQSEQPLLARYLQGLTDRSRSRAVRPPQPRRALKRLLEMQRTYPHAAFITALQQALRFGLFDLQRLEALILKHVSGEFFALDAEQQDEDEEPETEK